MHTPHTPASTAAALLPLVGGPTNITSVAHCMTRLRLGLADRSLVDDEAVRSVPGVLGLVADDDTYQIVLGPGVVARVTPEFEALVTQAAQLASHGGELRENQRQRNATPSSRPSAASQTSSSPSSPPSSAAASSLASTACS